MTYRRNFFSYFNFLGISFCIFIAWASYFGYKSLVINGLLAFFVFCVLKCVMFAKFKNDILENDTPFLFKLSNHGVRNHVHYHGPLYFLYKSLFPNRENLIATDATRCRNQVPSQINIHQKENLV